MRWLVPLLFWPLSALAGPGDWGEVSLVPGWQDADGTYHAAFVIDMEPGWKTYWRVPGDGGIPPDLDPAASANLAGFSVTFPAPEVEWDGDILSIGYHGRVVLPLTLQPADPAAPLDLSLRFFIGVCAEICIPAEGRLELRLVPGSAAANRDMIEAALARGPVAGGRATCTLRPEGEAYVLTAEIGGLSGTAALAVIESPDPMHLIAPVRLGGNGPVQRVETAFLSYAEGPVVLDRSRLRFSLIGGANVTEFTGCSG
jgi:DsbC/DsbD-like thiol-disulfide interchange protein